MIKYYNKKTQFNDIYDNGPDMFAGLDEIGRENSLNMLEP